MIGLIVRPQVCAVLHDDWVYLIDGETASRYFIHSHQIDPSRNFFSYLRYSLSERTLDDLPPPAEDFSQAGFSLLLCGRLKDILWGKAISFG